ncbi:MAG: histidine kinase [Kofleriaceae bacterium]
MRPEVVAARRAPSTLRVAFAVWTLFGLLCAASSYWDVRTHGHSPVRIFAYVLVVWWGWAAATSAVAWLGRRAPLFPFTWSASALHAGCAIVFGVIHHVWWTSLHLAIRPYDDMGTHSLWPAMSNDVRDRLFLEVVIYFAVLGVTYAVDYQRRLRDRELRAAQLEATLVHARLDALELQLQPHFLFNTLHAIGGLVRQNRGPQAIEMIAGLSDLLRYSLDHAGKHLVPLDQEVAILERYLEIQSLRFSDRLAVTVDVPRELRSVRVPALLLQPLVENAVRHGIERVVEPGRIEVRAHRVGATLAIEIFNTGPALAERGEHGIGITNTRERLQQLYGGRYSFALRSERDGVVVKLSIPFDEAAT